MAQNRSERPTPFVNQTPVVVEMLRQASESSKPKEEDKEEGKVPLFWRIFGGTMLSIVSLVFMSAYQSLSGGLAEVRQEMSHLNTDLHKEIGRFSETQGELVKKDEVSTRIKGVWTSIGELQEDRKELVTLKERCQAVQTQFKGAEEHRRELAMEVHRLREQQAVEQERRALVNELSGLRERLAGLEARKPAVSEPVMQRID